MNKEADLENPETIAIHSDYMYLQDLGSAAYTEFEHDDVTEHIMDNEELMDYRVGLIHSHHVMKAFFSGTDSQELKEKSENGLYLSLIVNNHMEPVAKIGWAGETEREIVSYTGWSFGGFNRKKRKHTRKEVVKVHYEIDLDIEFGEESKSIADRYAKLLEADRSFALEAKQAHQGHQMNFGSGIKYPSMKNGYESSWDRRIRLEKEEEEKADKLGSYDFMSRDGQSITLSNGEADLATQLERFNKLNTAFAAILTEDPKTELFLAGAIDLAKEEVTNIVTALIEVEETADLENNPEKPSFMKMYNMEAEEYAKALIDNGDDILAEMIGEFYLEEAEYDTVLMKMYDALSKLNKTILGEHLRQQIVIKTIGNENETT